MSRKNKPGFFEKPGFCNRSLPSAFCLLPSALCLLPSALCLPPSAFCLLPSAFRPLLSSYALLIVTKTSGLRLVCS